MTLVFTWQWDSSVQNKIQQQAFKTRNTKEQRSGKVEEKQRMEKKGEEEEAEASGETAIDQMEVARDMEVTGVVVVSGCDNKN